MDAIVFNDIWKTYKKEIGARAHTALRGVSFRLPVGETLGLIGANGAGKSTCIRLIMDFIRPDKGLIEVLGKGAWSREVRGKIGFLPEVPGFPPNLNILDMLRFTGATCNLPGRVCRERSEKWLKRLGLWDVRTRPLRNYSKGMQQRANFCLALMNDAELFILDEPMSGLDPIARSGIISLIQELKQTGKTILFCSHILEDIDLVADKILVLHKGLNLFYGTPQGLCRESQAEELSSAFLNLVSQTEDGHVQIH